MRVPPPNAPHLMPFDKVSGLSHAFPFFFFFFFVVVVVGLQVMTSLRARASQDIEDLRPKSPPRESGKS